MANFTAPEGARFSLGQPSGTLLALHSLSTDARWYIEWLDRRPSSVANYVYRMPIGKTGTKRAVWANTELAGRAWADEMAATAAARLVGRTVLESPWGVLLVSTVDTALRVDALRQLGPFMTLVFGLPPPGYGYGSFWSTRDEAVTGHLIVVGEVMQMIEANEIRRRSDREFI